MNIKPTLNKSLFAQVEFSDEQTVLNIYGPMPAKKLKAIVNVIQEGKVKGASDHPGFAGPPVNSGVELRKLLEFKK